MAAFAETRSRIPLVISGDLHDIGIGRITRSGKIDLKANPVTAVLGRADRHVAWRLAVGLPRRRRHAASPSRC